MSSSVFGQTYAGHYDLLYGDKEYEAECDLIENVFRRYRQGDVNSILDLGCGTGNHVIPLVCRGYRVTGVDISADMLAHAREKASGVQSPSGSAPPAFFQGDMRNIDLDQQFDAALMMFAVLGYQLTNDDVLAALRTVRRHLRLGGLLVCDVWYGPAVLNIRPSERIKVITTPDGQLIRATTGLLDTYNHLCDVRYRLWRVSGREVIDETEESHQMRYFFPQELALFFSQTGFELLDIHAFGVPQQQPSETTWNVLVTARVR